MNVAIQNRLPLSNDWTGLSYKELTEKVAQEWRAQNQDGYLSRSALKDLTHQAKTFIEIGNYAGIKEVFGDQSSPMTHADPTARAAMRLVDASIKQRKRILFELGEGRA